jgi:starch synthase
VPIVRATGGLADTIENFNPRTENGNGFCFTEYSSKTLVDTIRRALEVFEDKKTWWKLVKNAMKCDYSWQHSAAQYLSLYKDVKKKTSRPNLA